MTNWTVATRLTSTYASDPSLPLAVPCVRRAAYRSKYRQKNRASHLLSRSVRRESREEEEKEEEEGTKDMQQAVETDTEEVVGAEKNTDISKSVPSEDPKTAKEEIVTSLPNKDTLENTKDEEPTKTIGDQGENVTEGESVDQTVIKQGLSGKDSAKRIRTVSARSITKQEEKRIIEPGEDFEKKGLIEGNSPVHNKEETEDGQLREEGRSRPVSAQSLKREEIKSSYEEETLENEEVKEGDFAVKGSEETDAGLRKDTPSAKSTEEMSRNLSENSLLNEEANGNQDADMSREENILDDNDATGEESKVTSAKSTNENIRSFSAMSIDKAEEYKGHTELASEEREIKEDEHDATGEGSKVMNAKSANERSRTVSAKSIHIAEESKSQTEFATEETEIIENVDAMQVGDSRTRKLTLSGKSTKSQTRPDSGNKTEITLLTAASVSTAGVATIATSVQPESLKNLTEESTEVDDELFVKDNEAQEIAKEIYDSPGTNGGAEEGRSEGVKDQLVLEKHEMAEEEVTLQEETYYKSDDNVSQGSNNKGDEEKAETANTDGVGNEEISSPLVQSTSLNIRSVSGYSNERKRKEDDDIKHEMKDEAKEEVEARVISAKSSRIMSSKSIQGMIANTTEKEDIHLAADREEEKVEDKGNQLKEKEDEEGNMEYQTQTEKELGYENEDDAFALEKLGAVTIAAVGAAGTVGSMASLLTAENKDQENSKKEEGKGPPEDDDIGLEKIGAIAFGALGATGVVGSLLSTEKKNDTGRFGEALAAGSFASEGDSSISGITTELSSVVAPEAQGATEEQEEMKEEKASPKDNNNPLGISALGATGVMGIMGDILENETKEKHLALDEEAKNDKVEELYDDQQMDTGKEKEEEHEQDKKEENNNLESMVLGALGTAGAMVAMGGKLTKENENKGNEEKEEVAEDTSKGDYLISEKTRDETVSLDEERDNEANKDMAMTDSSFEDELVAGYEQEDDLGNEVEAQGDVIAKEVTPIDEKQIIGDAEVLIIKTPETGKETKKNIESEGAYIDNNEAFSTNQGTDSTPTNVSKASSRQTSAKSSKGGQAPIVPDKLKNGHMSAKSVKYTNANLSAKGEKDTNGNISENAGQKANGNISANGEKNSVSNILSKTNGHISAKERTDANGHVSAKKEKDTNGQISAKEEKGTNGNMPSAILTESGDDSLSLLGNMELNNATMQSQCCILL